ncbi:DUF3501 family protein [Azospirillum doebereinerae]
MAAKTAITRADILPMAQYARERLDRRKALVAVKRNRRLPVGPDATFYFESYETMWQQIHEMLHIEKGGEEQIADELHAYNPLIPKGRELVATVMFEIDDPARRDRVLSALGGIEGHMTIQIGETTIAGRPEGDVERTNAAGKTSSVHFLHFDVTDEQVAAFREPGARVLVGIAHPNYGHLAVMPEAVRAELAKDFA